MKTVIIIFLLACAVTGVTAFLMYSGGEKQAPAQESPVSATEEKPAAETPPAAEEEPEAAAESEAEAETPAVELEPEAKPEAKAEPKPKANSNPLARYKRPGAGAAKTEEKVASAMETGEKPKAEPKGGAEEPAKGEQAPTGKEPAAPAKPAAQVRISLPPAIQNVQFGMAAKAVAELSPPAWRKEEEGTLTFVYYLDKAKSQEARFDFREKGLERIELRCKPTPQQTVGALYEQIQQFHQKTYGSLPGSTPTKWSDGHMTLSLSKGKGYAGLTFTSAE